MFQPLEGQGLPDGQRLGRQEETPRHTCCSEEQKIPRPQPQPWLEARHPADPAPRSPPNNLPRSPQEAPHRYDGLGFTDADMEAHGSRCFPKITEKGRGTDKMLTQVSPDAATPGTVFSKLLGNCILTRNCFLIIREINCQKCFHLEERVKNKRHQERLGRPPGVERPSSGWKCRRRVGPGWPGASPELASPSAAPAFSPRLFQESRFRQQVTVIFSFCRGSH